MCTDSKRQSLLSAVLQVGLARKRRWFFAFFAAQATVFFEVGFISCIYFLIDGGRRTEFITRIDAIPWLNLNLSGLSESASVSMFAVSGVMLLVLSFGIRYINEINMIRLMYDLYVQDSQMLIHRYLLTSPLVARQIGKEKITSSILLDCGAIGLVTKLSIHAFSACCGILVYVAGAVFLSWQILLVAALVYAVPLWLSRKLYARMQEIGSLKVKTQERVIGYFNDILDGFNRSKVDGLEPFLRERSGKVLRKSQTWRIRKKKTKAVLHLVMEGLPFMGLLIVFYAGIVVFSVKLVVLMTLFIIFNRIKASIGIISNSCIRIREYIPNVYRHLEILEALGAKVRWDALERTYAQGTISKVEMKGVLFKYAEEPVLKGLNFEGRTGDRILIEGPSGQGKSTFLEVLCGLLPPLTGSVLYDGKPLDGDLFYGLRPLIAYVAPTVYLFRDTLKNNLIMGCQGNGAELEDAIRLAGLEEVVKEMPDGLDSLIGTNGDRLSIGQRQRLILARLYLKKPNLILLDEATSNLDPELENEIVENLLSFIDPEAILIMVAHKAPPNIKFNKRFIMENGRLKHYEACGG